MDFYLNTLCMSFLFSLSGGRCQVLLIFHSWKLGKWATKIKRCK